MADDPLKRGSADPGRINVNVPHEVRYWAEKLGCSEADLRAAVRRAGDRATDVEAELQVNRHEASPPQR